MFMSFEDKMEEEICVHSCDTNRFIFMTMMEDPPCDNPQILGIKKAYRIVDDRAVSSYAEQFRAFLWCFRGLNRSRRRFHIRVIMFFTVSKTMTRRTLQKARSQRKKRVCGISNMFRCSRHWLHLANPRRGAVLGVRLE